MNAPAGFKMVDGQFTEIDPIAAMLNPASFHEVLHMTLAAFVATGFAVAAVHAFFLRRDRNNLFHRCALGIALAVACVSIPLQILSGDYSARVVGRLQPAKLAAMEAHYRTQTGAPLLIGGIPNDETRTTDYAHQYSARIESASCRQPQRQGRRAGRVPANQLAQCAHCSLVV